MSGFESPAPASASASASASAPASASASAAAALPARDVSSDESDGEDAIARATLEVEYFDEKSDDKDEAWAKKQRSGRKSDAVLSCPACFTTLCIDCQRHEKYVQQYRAMFVTNCRTVETERLRVPARPPVKKHRNRRNKATASSAAANVQIPTDTGTEDDIFNPVHCSVCDTEVAVIDKDEVYHFFNIMPSYS